MLFVDDLALPTSMPNTLPPSVTVDPTRPVNATLPAATGSPPAFVNCSDTLYKPVGFIVSPFYPDHYPNNANCMWSLSVETSHQIILSFNFFALDYYDGDVLLLYDNSTENGSLILSRTGQCARYPNSSCPHNDFHSFITNSFSLQFKSDSFVTDRGFNITYEIQQIGW